MKKSLKTGIALGLLTLSSAALASCGGTRINPYDLDFSVDTNGTSINFWTPFGSAIQEHVDLICENFEKETGIHVNVETKGGYDNLEKAITLAAASQKYPHVALAYPDHMANYVNSDIIVRLDYYLENDGDDTFKLTDCYKDYLEEVQSVEFEEAGNGYTLGLPFNKSTEVMCYNKQFFAWAQQTDPSIKVPATWGELATVGPKIRSFVANYFGQIVGDDYKTYKSALDLPTGVKALFNFTTVNEDNFFPVCYDSQANLFITAVRQWGGTYTEVDKATKKGYLAFDSEEAKSALAYFNELYEAKVFAVPSCYGGTTTYGSSYFGNCQSVMNIGSSAGVANSIGKTFETGIAPLPYKDEDKKFVISQGTDAVLLDTGTQVERVAAWKFMKYLTKEADGYFASKTSYFPSCDYAAKSKDYQQKVTDTSAKKTYADVVWYESNDVNDKEYLNEAKKWTKFTDPAFVGSSTVRTELDTCFSELFIDNLTPAELIAKLKNKLKEYVK